MKKAKRIFAIFMSLAMILTMSIAMGATAFAGDNPGGEGGDTPAATTPDYDHPLKITGLAKGDVAHFYHVVTWNPDAEGNVSGWVAVAPFDSVLTKAELTKALVGDKATGITAELAGKLARAIEATTKSTDVTVTGTEAELDNSAAGIYMAIITPADVDTVYNPVFVSADFNKEAGGDWPVTEAASYSDESAAKKSTVTLDKSAATDESKKDWADKKWTTTAIGDTVHFTVNTTIPGYGTLYEHPMFKMTDKLTDLELVAKSVKITDPTIDASNYTITESTDGYTIEFKEAYLKTVKTPTAIKVEYDAVVTTEAPLNVNAEKNEVSTEFSHNPSDESDHGFKKDTTQHYTFTIDAEGLAPGEKSEGKKTSEVVKVGLDAEGKPITETTETSSITSTEKWESPLAGAEFTLYTDSACKKPYKDKDGKDVVVTTGADGRMTIAGLDAGTYYLKETKAPAGFVADTTAAKVEIEATTAEVELTEYTTDGATWISQADYDKKTAEEKKAYKSYTYKTEVLKSYTVKINGQATATYHFKNNGTNAEIEWTEEPPVEKPFQFKNTKGTELPSTGGIGTIIFYVLGTILVLVSAIVLISKRRMQNR